MLSHFLGIADTNHTLKLAVFDSMFKVMGVVIFVLFTGMLVSFLQRKLKSKELAHAGDIETAQYLNDSALEFPYTAVIATDKVVKRLYPNTHGHLQ